MSRFEIRRPMKIFNVRKGSVGWWEGAVYESYNSEVYFVGEKVNRQKYEGR